MSNRLTLDPLLVTEPARRFQPPLRPQLPLQQPSLFQSWSGLLIKYSNGSQLPFYIADGNVTISHINQSAVNFNVQNNLQDTVNASLLFYFILLQIFELFIK